MTQLPELLSNLKLRGLRTTRLRTTLLQLLEAQPAPCSVKELQVLLMAQGLHPNKTTLYREIESLRAEGIVTIATMNGTKKVYLSPEGHHPHFMCTTCGRSICLSSGTVSATLARATDELAAEHCTVDAYDVTIYGRCGRCGTQTATP